MREYDRVYDEEQGREREFVRTYHPEIPFTPNLPFITEMPSAQFTPARSPDLRDIAEEMYEDAIEGAKEDTETE